MPKGTETLHCKKFPQDIGQDPRVVQVKVPRRFWKEGNFKHQHSTMKLIKLSMVPMFLLVWACSTDGGIPRYLEEPSKALESVPEEQLPELEYEREYLVKAGI